MLLYCNHSEKDKVNAQNSNRNYSQNYKAV